MTIYHTLIAKVFIPHFHRYGEDAIKHTLNSTVARQCFLSVYREMELDPDKTEDEKIIQAVGEISNHLL